MCVVREEAKNQTQTSYPSNISTSDNEPDEFHSYALITIFESFFSLQLVLFIICGVLT